VRARDAVSKGRGTRILHVQESAFGNVDVNRSYEAVIVRHVRVDEHEKG
jgi:hypothetical protein